MGLHMAQLSPTTTPRAASDGTVVTTASDSPLAPPKSTAGDLFPAGAHKAHFKRRGHSIHARAFDAGGADSSFPPRAYRSPRRDCLYHPPLFRRRFIMCFCFQACDKLEQL